MDELETCVTAWEQGNRGARDAAAKALGIGLNDTIAQSIAALLEQANGERRKFRLSTKDVLSTIRDALASPHGLAVRHGGAEAFTKTTLCFVVKPPNGDEVAETKSDLEAGRRATLAVAPSIMIERQRRVRTLPPAGRRMRRGDGRWEGGSSAAGVQGQHDACATLAALQSTW
jgi:hypothetical protein